MNNWLIFDYEDSKKNVSVFTVHSDGTIIFGNIADIPSEHVKRIKNFVTNNLKAFIEASSPIYETVTVAFISKNIKPYLYIFKEGDLRDND